MRTLKASFTIEAAVIVPLSLFIVMAFIYMTFYVHDKVVMKTVGVGYILENAAQYSENTQNMQAYTLQMLEDRLIAAENVDVEVSEDNGISLESSAQFALVPSYAQDILDSSFGQLEVSVNVSVLDGRTLLLKYKAISDGIGLLTGDDE